MMIWDFQLGSNPVFQVRIMNFLRVLRILHISILHHASGIQVVPVVLHTSLKLHIDLHII